MRKIYLVTLITAFISGCTAVEQRRITSFDQVSCNLDHVNNETKRLDRLMGMNFGGVFGYKTKCSNQGYRQTADGPLMGEAEAISAKCDSLYGGISPTSVDGILSEGGKIISVLDVQKSVDVFNKDGKIQPGNMCLGKEYIIEASDSVFKTYIEGSNSLQKSGEEEVANSTLPSKSWIERVMQQMNAAICDSTNGRFNTATNSCMRNEDVKQKASVPEGVFIEMVKNGEISRVMINNSSGESGIYFVQANGRRGFVNITADGKLLELLMKNWVEITAK